MMRRRLGSAAVASVVLLGCGGPADVDLHRIVPPQGLLGGWEVVGEPAEYGPDTLYDYLDGGAERYLSYGFQRLLHLRYERPGDSRSGVTLDLFDMGSDLGAFGIYSMARRPASRSEDWGVEGWCEEDVAHAWQGRVYLHAFADVPEPAATSMLPQLMAAAAGRIPGEPTLPSVLEPLPTGDRVPRSERWVAANLLGHGFLPGGVVAGYRLDGRDALLFVSDLGGDRPADEAVARLRAHWQERAAVTDLAAPGRGGFRYMDAILGAGAVTAIGRHVAVVHCDDPDLPADAAQRLLVELASSLAGGDRGRRPESSGSPAEIATLSLDRRATVL